MKVVMHRGYCDAALSFCARCSATHFRKPEGADRPCIVRVIDDGQDDVGEVILCTDQRNLRFALTPEVQEGLSVEGWEYLADFAPGYIRRGAHRRWKSLQSAATVG
jgi:hypothetical protein